MNNEKRKKQFRLKMGCKMIAGVSLVVGGLLLIGQAFIAVTAVVVVVVFQSVQILYVSKYNVLYSVEKLALRTCKNVFNIF